MPSRDGSLTYVYTSIGALPIHHTLPHVKGSESLSMAKSHDNGLTWQKYASNPILPSEPPNLEVTGFRDPFVSAWPSMAAALDLDAESTLFGIISGGIRDVTPTTFLYSIEAADPTKWTYIGPLVNFGLNSRPSKWSGDLGVNWEVTNFATLSDSSDPSVSREFLIMGTEGCLPSALSPSSTSTTPTRPARNQLWMSGPLARASPSNSSSPVTMPFAFGSHLDHGAFYAANSFFCPKLRKHVVWGWVTEEDLCDELRREQGWSGMLSLPREISLQTMRNVVGAWSSDLKSITSVECEAEAEGQGAYTVRTLASEPVREVVEKLRRSARAATSAKTSGTALPGRDGSGLAFDVRTTAWELDVGFRLAKTCREVGVQIVHSSSVGAFVPIPSIHPSIHPFRAKTDLTDIRSRPHTPQNNNSLLRARLRTPNPHPSILCLHPITNQHRPDPRPAHPLHNPPPAHRRPLNRAPARPRVARQLGARSVRQRADGAERAIVRGLRGERGGEVLR